MHVWPWPISLLAFGVTTRRFTRFFIAQTFVEPSAIFPQETAKNTQMFPINSSQTLFPYENVQLSISNLPHLSVVVSRCLHPGCLPKRLIWPILLFSWWKLCETFLARSRCVLIVAVFQGCLDEDCWTIEFLLPEKRNLRTNREFKKKSNLKRKENWKV